MATFIFALVMTVAVIVTMTRITVREEVKVRESVGAALLSREEQEELDTERHGLSGRGDMFFVFGRYFQLLVWSCFVFGHDPA